ncbi:protein crumbs homolog 3 isoform 2-T4 [Megaptera novaeangliae]
MASPGLGLLLALGLPLLLTRWGRVWGQTPDPTVSGNSTITPSGPSPGSNGALSQEATIAIIVVFSLLAALLLAVGLVLLVRKLREKRQTEGTYRPSSEEQFSHAAEAQAPQDSKETVVCPELVGAKGPWREERALPRNPTLGPRSLEPTSGSQRSTLSPPVPTPSQDLSSGTRPRSSQGRRNRTLPLQTGPPPLSDLGRGRPHLQGPWKPACTEGP